MENQQHSVHHFYVPYYQQIQKYPYPEYILGLKTDIDNQYVLYSWTCVYVSYMHEGVEFTVSYAPVDGICCLWIITEIASTEGRIIFVLDIYNDSHNTILPNIAEIVYLILSLYTAYIQL